MRKEIMISGFGGQGILLAGNVLCHAAMSEDRFSTFFPSYGAEMRGGTAKCHIIISDEPIGSPIVYTPDVLVALSKQSYDKYGPLVKKGGLILANSSLYEPEALDGVEVVGVPANALAEKSGSAVTANIVMLGSLVAKTGIVNNVSMTESLPEVLTAKKKKLWPINKEAFDSGFAYDTKHGSRRIKTGGAA